MHYLFRKVNINEYLQECDLYNKINFFYTLLHVLYLCNINFHVCRIGREMVPCFKDNDPVGTLVTVSLTGTMPVLSPNCLIPNMKKGV